MLDLDQRVSEGLRTLADRAPVDADVWPAAARHVAKRRRTRRVVAGGSLALVLVAGGLTAAGGAHEPSRVRVSEPRRESHRPPAVRARSMARSR